MPIPHTTAELAVKALGVWVVILVLAMLNGVFRETVLIPKFGSAPGLIVSGLLLSGLILAVTFFLLLPWVGAHSASHFLLIGFGWLILTLIFEFSFGLLRGKSLAEILEAYTFTNANLWPVVLVVTAAAPWLTARLRGWI